MYFKILPGLVYSNVKMILQGDPRYVLKLEFGFWGRGMDFASSGRTSVKYSFNLSTMA